MRKNHRKPVMALAIGTAAALTLSGCFFSGPQPLETSATAEMSAETSSSAEETSEEAAESTKASQGQPTLRDAMVMVNGTLYIWAYDTELTETPEGYEPAGTVTPRDEGRPEKDLEGLRLQKGAEVYVSDASASIYVNQDGSWSAFIPYDDVASAYEYSKDPWVYDASQNGGFLITFPDGSWQQKEIGDSGIYNFAGNGGTVSIIQMSQEAAEEIYPYIDTEEACQDLILNTGISGNFEILAFDAGLADSGVDPDASYYHVQVRYTDEAPDYGFEERYALYCGGRFWQVQILMKDGGDQGREKAAGILDSFTVPTCESQ